MNWAFPPMRRAWWSTKVEKGPAQRFFKRGDIVLEVNGAKIDSVDALNAALADETQHVARSPSIAAAASLKLAIGG